MNNLMIGYLVMGILMAVGTIATRFSRGEKIDRWGMVSYLAMLPLWPFFAGLALAAMLRKPGVRCAYCNYLAATDREVRDHFAVCKKHPMYRLTRASWALLDAIVDTPLSMEASLAEIELKQELRRLDPQGEPL
jgi:hypothetical protein